MDFQTKEEKSSFLFPPSFEEEIFGGRDNDIEDINPDFLDYNDSPLQYCSPTPIDSRDIKEQKREKIQTVTSIEELEKLCFHLRNFDFEIVEKD